ncbi:TetR/AcrR family transcriptional regulator [Brevundimonas sp.]|uniref:TetR/AcrR family transcriptional regulator n=1 Tax=Brevundimonas sp. TaxID=1871086 RepID=UPI0039E59329
MSGVTRPNRRSARKPKGEGHSRRAEILAAAEQIFVEHGYEGATIRKIADEVGLSSTALYMHFSDKQEILHEICRQSFETLIALNRTVLDSPGEPEVRMRRMMEAYVTFGFAHPNAYRLVYLTRPLEARDGAESVAQQLGADLFRSFETLVEDVERAGRLRGEVRASTQALWAGGHGVVSLMITKPYFDWVDRETLVKTLMDALFMGLLKP